MWVESEPGKGSTFHFTIQAERAPARPDRPARREHSHLAGRRVLIVDDNETNRQILDSADALMGNESPGGSFRRTRLSHSFSGKPVFDLALLDMHMPGMDGLTLAHEIRRNPSARALPLLMLSSGSSRRELTNSVEQDLFAAYLSKPVKPSQLYDAVVTVLDTRVAQNSWGSAGTRAARNPETAARLRSCWPKTTSSISGSLCDCWKDLATGLTWQ